MNTSQSSCTRGGERTVALQSMRTAFAMLLFVTLAAPCAAQSFWKQLQGPVSTDPFYSFFTHTVIASRSGNLFAGTDEGVFRSSDGGRRWVKASYGLNASPRSVVSLAELPDGTLLAGSPYGYGVFRSTNLGAEWLPANSGILNMSLQDNRGIWSLACDPASGVVYAAADSSIVYRSTNSGRSWEAFNVAPATEYRMQRVFVAGNGDVFALISSNAFRSTDHGAHWAQEPGAWDANWLCEDSHGNMYRAQTGVELSTDNGATWTVIREKFPFKYVLALAVNSNGEVFVAYEYDGVWKSTDKGASWDSLSYTGSTQISSILPVAGDTVLFATWDGMWRSDDDGANWAEATYGMGLGRVEALLRANNGVLFAGTDGGFFRSTDRGTNWEGLTFGLHRDGVFGFTEGRTGELYAASTWGLHVSSDSGSHWRNISDSHAPHLIVREVAVDSRGTILIAAPNEGVLRSTDMGNSWTNVNDGVLPSGADGYRIINAGKDTVLLSARSCGVFLSTNQGQNWRPRNNGLTNLEIYDFVRGPLGELYLATGGGLFVSSDQGSVWEKRDVGIANLSVNSIAVNSAGNIYAGISELTGPAKYTRGVIRSIDHGRSWQRWNSGLGDVFVARIATDAEGYVWLGTASDGVYRSEGIALAVRPHTIDSDDAYALHQNHPNPFRTRTGLTFELPVEAPVTLCVCNMYGRELRVLVHERLRAGQHSVDFDAADLPDGMYICTMSTPSVTRSRIMTVLR